MSTALVPVRRPAADPRLLEILDEAELLWHAGHCLAAAMLCRAVLERHLAALCRAWIHPDFPLRRSGSPEVKLYRLRARGVLDTATMRRVRKLLDVANRAAHATAMTPCRAARILGGARGFLAATTIDAAAAGRGA